MAPACAALASLLVATALSTTGASSGSALEATPPSRLAVSANLLGLATLNPTLDVEAKIVGPLTLGVTGWWEVRSVEDRWGQVRVSFYPFGTAMKGLGVAVTGGVHRAYREADSRDSIRSMATSPTVGLLASYDLRVLRSEHLRLGIAAGAKVTLSDHDDRSPLKPIYAELRLHVGWVF